MSKPAAMFMCVFSAVAMFAAFSANMLADGAAASRTEAVRRNLTDGAELCRAMEGFYPPSLDFLMKRYNFSIDKNKYTITYEYDEDIDDKPIIEVMPR